MSYFTDYTGMMLEMQPEEFNAMPTPDSQLKSMQQLMTSWRERAEKAEAELERLTTLRPASEHDGTTDVIWWRRNHSGYIHAYCVERYKPWWNTEHWTPLPELRETRRADDGDRDDVQN